MPSQQTAIDRILSTAKTIAVVGLSGNELRPSYGVSEYMQDAGYRIIPVNPAEEMILGEKSYPSLEAIPEPVDCVDVFRKPDAVPAIVASAIAIGAKSVWLQEGVTHAEAGEQARAAGLDFVEDVCILKEHRRWKSAR